MANRVKEVSAFNGTSWGAAVPLGANDVNIDITSNTTQPNISPSGSDAYEYSLDSNDVIVAEGDTDATAWTKYNRFRKRIQHINQMKTIRVGTFNVGCFARGDNNLSTLLLNNTAAVNEMKQAWKNRLGQINCDILCCQEWSSIFEDDKGQILTDDIYQSRYSYRSYHGTNDIFSSVKQYNIGFKEFDNNTLRNYHWLTIPFANTQVYIVNTHLDHQDGNTTNRQAQIADLLQFLQGKTFILCGDFNVYSTSEFDAFTNLNYRLANHGDFGDFATWPDINSTWPNSAIDNIITSPSIYIKNVGIDYRVPQSDHAFLYADLDLSRLS